MCIFKPKDHPTRISCSLDFVSMTFNTFNIKFFKFFTFFLFRNKRNIFFYRMPGTMDTSSSRTVRLERRRNAPFGFSVRGGREHGTGLFVSHIEPGSSAQCHGLKVLFKLSLFYIYIFFFSFGTKLHLPRITRSLLLSHHLIPILNLFSLYFPIIF